MIRLGGFIGILASAMITFTACNKAVEEDIPVLITLADDAFYTQEGQSVVLDILANDQIKGHNMVLTLSDPAHGEIVPDAGTAGFTYTPAPGFSGVEEMEYEVCTGNTCKSASVTVQVEPASGCVKKLIALNDYVSTNSDTILINIQTLLANDFVECDEIDASSFMLREDPALGKIMLDNNVLVIIINQPNWINDQFEYRVCTVSGSLCASAKVTLTNNAADVPVLQ